jgi:hypothetical protein
MKQKLNEVVSASITTDTPTITTDALAAKYELRLTQNIIRKTVAAGKEGVPPQFTEAERAYLNRKDEEEMESSEMKVITPDPTITLKKGDTEINIKNAATLVKKMEEIYPSPKHSSINDEIEVTEGKWVARKGNVKECCNNEDVVPTVVTQKPFNKNAYEIRAEMLAQALSWVQYKRNLECEVYKDVTDFRVPTEDDVLSIAQKFYKFVENRG